MNFIGKIKLSHSGDISSSV